MKLTKEQLTIKYGVYCLLILLAEMLQNVYGLWPEIFGSRCFFIIPTVVILGIDEEPQTAAFLGMFAGFLWDCVSTEHMGFNFVIITLICYIISFLTDYLFRATFWVQVVAAGVASAFYLFVYWLIFMVINRSDGSVNTVFYFYVPSIIYTCVMGIAVCFVLTPIKTKLNKGIKIVKK